MASNNNEKDIVKAISGLLSQDLLGLKIHDELETSHHSQFRWSGIGDAFRLKALKSPYYDSLCAAFTKIHDHKYLDHPTFKLAMENEMRSMGLPGAICADGLKYVDQLMNEIGGKKLSERDAGWNPAMDELRDITSNADNRTPEKSKPFTGGGPIPESIDRKKKR